MQALALSPFDAAAILIVSAAALGWVNHRFFGLPSATALTVMGALASIIVIGVDAALPQSRLAETVRSFLAGIDFHQTLMEGMLSFLLFAGALHVDLDQLRRGKQQIALLSTVGVIASTLLVGAGFWALTRAVGFDLPLVWCFVFGALVSPTDPVAVMGVLGRAKVPPRLQATVAGESLFNDGVGVVVFSIVLGAAVSGGGLSLVSAGELFLTEALGGAALGLAAGWIGFRAMRAIDDYPLEVLITLAIVMGGYSLAHAIHVSGPVAMAVAGLLIGNHGVSHAMSEVTRDHLIKFWALIDEVLNAVLFLLIGLEGVVLATGDPRLFLIGGVAIPLVLAVRALTVGVPLVLWRKLLPFGLAFPVLTWGGLRGGISIALALSLPPGPVKDLILAATYFVVLFSVVVQGSTLSRIVPKEAAGAGSSPSPAEP